MKSCETAGCEDYLIVVLHQLVEHVGCRREDDYIDGEGKESKDMKVSFALGVTHVLELATRCLQCKEPN